jgi:hypothetical protein
MTHWSLSNVLFSLQIFPYFLLLLLSWVLVLLHWDQLVCRWLFQVSYIKICFVSIFKKVWWSAEKNVYCIVAGWNIVKTSVRSLRSFSCRISLLTFLSGWPNYW